MEIITALFAAAVAAMCFISIVANDLRERKAARGAPKNDVTSSN